MDTTKTTPAFYTVREAATELRVDPGDALPSHPGKQLPRGADPQPLRRSEQGT